MDTRDMAADGLTKGSVDRKALVDIMDGKLVVRHATKSLRAQFSKNT